MELKFWKPTKSGKGAAAFLSIQPDGDAAYVTMMPQRGEDLKSFDKDRRIVAKLDLTDMGEMLAVIRGTTDGLGEIKNDKYSGRFHKNDRGQTIIRFEKSDSRPGFVLGLNQTRDNTNSSFMVGITLGEAEQIRVFLDAAMTRILVNSFGNWRAGGGNNRTENNGRNNDEAAESEVVAGVGDSAEIPF